MPKTRQEFWKNKLEGNALRDQEKQDALRNLGWKVIVLWECEIEKTGAVTNRLNQLLGRTLSDGPRTQDKIT